MGCGAWGGSLSSHHSPLERSRRQTAGQHARGAVQPSSRPDPLQATPSAWAAVLAWNTSPSAFMNWEKDLRREQGRRRLEHVDVALLLREVRAGRQGCGRPLQLHRLFKPEHTTHY